MTANWSPNLASLGRCSLIFRPAALVSISLNGPPLAWPGLRSHRSMVLGPPLIHSRMHERLRLGSRAAPAARRSSQPDIEAPAKPAVVSRSRSRREKVFGEVMSGISRFEGRLRLCRCEAASGLVTEQELAAVEQDPEDVGQGPLLPLREAVSISRRLAGAAGL